MEQTTQATTETQATPARPVFLTVLCILSFIAAGFAILGYVTVLTLMGAASSIASGSIEGMSAEANTAMAEAMAKVPSAGLTWAYLIVGFLTVIVSLFGVIKMWKLQKVGYFMYVGASVVSMIMGMVYSGFGVMAIIFPVLFIALYGMNLKHMK